LPSGYPAPPEGAVEAQGHRAIGGPVVWRGLCWSLHRRAQAESNWSLVRPAQRVGAGRLGTFAVVRRIRPPGPAPPDDGQVGTNLRRMRALYGVEDRDRTEIKAAAPKILKSAPYLLLETHTPTGLTLSVLDSWESIRDRKPVTRIPRGSLDNAIASLREIAGGNSSAVEVRQSCTVGRLHCSRATEIRARRKPWSVDYPRPRFRRRKWGRFDRFVTLRLRSPRRHG
jgi:hypothetical protein